MTQPTLEQLRATISETNVLTYAKTMALVAEMNTRHPGIDRKGRPFLWRSAAHLLLEQGIHTRTMVHAPEKGVVGFCYQNAYALARQHGWTYCEGYAFGILLPVAHAWCLNAQGQVVETTWRHEIEADMVDYLGVPIQLSWMARYIRRTGCMSALQHPAFRIYVTPPYDWKATV